MQNRDFITLPPDVTEEAKGTAVEQSIERFTALFGIQFSEACATFRIEIARVLAAHFTAITNVGRIHLRAVEYPGLDILGVEVLCYDQHGQPLKRPDEILQNPCLNIIPDGHGKTTRLFGRPITTLEEISACASFPIAISYGRKTPNFPQQFGRIDHDQPITFSSAHSPEFWVVVSCSSDPDAQEITARLIPVPEECPVVATVYWHRFLQAQG